jgi:hypothetical protein
VFPPFFILFANPVFSLSSPTHTLYGHGQARRGEQ